MDSAVPCGEDSVGIAQSAFLSALEQLDAARGDAGLRIRTAWDDLVSFAAIHEQLVQEVEELQIPPERWQSMTPPVQEQMTQTMSLGQWMDALLKAAIVFGDVVHIRLLQYVFNEWEKDLTTTWLASPKTPAEVREWALRLPGDAYVGAHALRIYRNRLILHFERPRSAAAMASAEGVKDRRLLPIFFPGVNDRDHDTLEAIASRNRDLTRVATVREVESGKRNYWELLEALFYSIHPLTSDGKQNGDRLVIDGLAVVGGIKSPSMKEVLDMIVRFTAAVAVSPWHA